MPEGYDFKPQPNDVANAVLSKSTWAVMALTLDIEIFSQVHYRSSIEPDTELSELWKDVFLFHWKEESQHAILDELEWRREHAKLQRRRARPGRHRSDRAGRRGRRHLPAAGDAPTPTTSSPTSVRCPRRREKPQCATSLLKAYRWQYIVSGAQEPRFGEVLAELVTPAQMQRIGAALGPIVEHATRATH